MKDLTGAHASVWVDCIHKEQNLRRTWNRRYETTVVSSQERRKLRMKEQADARMVTQKRLDATRQRVMESSYPPPHARSKWISASYSQAPLAPLVGISTSTVSPSASLHSTQRLSPSLPSVTMTQRQSKAHMGVTLTDSIVDVRQSLTRRSSTPRLSLTATTTSLSDALFHEVIPITYNRPQHARRRVVRSEFYRKDLS